MNKLPEVGEEIIFRAPNDDKELIGKVYDVCGVHVLAKTDAGRIEYVSKLLPYDANRVNFDI
jgi:hypothetical protein